jgi:hypothetical protein
MDTETPSPISPLAGNVHGTQGLYGNGQDNQTAAPTPDTSARDTAWTANQRASEASNPYAGLTHPFGASTGAPPVNTGGALSQIASSLGNAAAANPYDHGTQAYQARYESGLNSINQNFAGSDQALMARSAANGGVSQGDFTAAGSARAAALSNYELDLQSNDGARQEQYTAGLLGNLGQVQDQGFKSQMQPYQIGAAGLANSGAAQTQQFQSQLQPYQVGASALANRGAAQTQQFAGDLHPANVNAANLANQVTSGHLDQFRDTYAAIVAKERSGAQLSQAEADQARWVSENQWWLGPAGVLTAALGPIAKIAGYAPPEAKA